MCQLTLSVVMMSELKIATDATIQFLAKTQLGERYVQALASLCALVFFSLCIR